MKIKGKQKYELAVMLSNARSKNHPLTIAQIMLMNKADFMALLRSYQAFCDADNKMGDPTP